ncbi:hypothetical protein PQX77_005174 [Marasmius sp. AFHP31]|nr:hypothetical protein PQX77_005174 [Marasmius sp. AFHP31]
MNTPFKFLYYYLDKEPTSSNFANLLVTRALVEARWDERVFELLMRVIQKHGATAACLYKIEKDDDFRNARSVKTLLANHKGSINAFATEIGDLQTVRDGLNNGGKQHIAIVVLDMSPPTASTPQPVTDTEDTITHLEADLHCFIQEIRTKNYSQRAKSKEYNTLQGSDSAICDGRSAKDKPATAAPPVELYHPVFSKFQKRAYDETASIPDETLRLTARLMRVVSVISVYETPRDHETRKILADLLNVLLVHGPNEDSTSFDSISPVLTPLKCNALALGAQVQSEMGEGGSDASVQAGFSFTRYWTSNAQSSMLDQSCCPSFLIGIAGPWLVIEGAVLTSRTIVQRLTPYIWLGCSRVLEDAQVYDIARKLYALKLGVKELAEYYHKFIVPNHVPGFIHPRFCPHITSFSRSSDNHKVDFVYVRPLEAEMGCVTFEAKLSTQEQHVVVKFVRQYGYMAHAYMAERRLAPDLIHFGLVGEGYGNLVMVVMELVEGRTLAEAYDVKAPLPPDILNNVREALKVLNSASYVHGDLRRQNIMLLDNRQNDDDTGIRIIDFDWVGEKGEVRYPPHTSSVVLGVAGAQEYDKIQQEHQDKLFEVL